MTAANRRSCAPAAIGDRAFAIAQLRHLYWQMVNRPIPVANQDECARFLLGPAIAALESASEAVEADEGEEIPESVAVTRAATKDALSVAGRPVSRPPDEDAVKGNVVPLRGLSFTIPVRTVSEANSHTHWRQRQKRAKAQRGTARLLTNHAMVAAGAYSYRFSLGRPTPALRIALTRIGPRKLDSDNLAVSCKHVRDGIADAIGLDDGSDRLEWVYEQVKGRPGEYAVRVTIERRQVAA